MSASPFPLLQGKPSGKHCSNCSSKMTLYALPGHYNSKVEIDVCMDCNAVWFDQFESIQLSADGTVALFQLIQERGGTATSASVKFSEGLRCITCGDGMKLTNDIVRGTRFSYQACRKGHGRFTTFYNVLAEKQFVRELTKGERARLAASVGQIRCSGCGAAVPIGKVDACEYCRAPISVFDRDAARKAIEHYLQERQKQKPLSTGDRREAGRSSGGHWNPYDRADLGSDILFALGHVAARGLSPAGRIAAAGVAGGATGVFAESSAVAATALPDATSALFGAGLASGAHASVAGAASSLATGLGGSMSEALPSATDALFGAVSGSAGDATAGLSGEFAGAFGDVAASGLVDVTAGAASELGGSVVEAVGSSALEAVGSGALDVTGDMASSVGEGAVDLVADGIGSLLGSLFS